MFHLIIVIISIVLSTSIVMTGVNLIPTEALEKQRVLQQAEKGLDSLEKGVVSYLNWNRDPEGFAVLPGIGDLKNELSPGYVFYPSPIRGGYTWHVQEGSYKGMPAIGICLKPTETATPNHHAAMETLLTRLPEDSAVLANGCNANTSTAGGTHLTSWIVLDHLNILANTPIELAPPGNESQTP